MNDSRKFILIQGVSINLDKIDYYTSKIEKGYMDSMIYRLFIVVNSRDHTFQFKEEASLNNVLKELDDLCNTKRID